MKVRLHAALVVLFALVFLPGCKKLLQKAGAGDAGTSTTTGPINKDSDRDVILGRKLDPYVVSCLNKFSHKIHDSERRYHQWVDEKAGPTGKGPVYGVYQVTDVPTVCSNAVAKGNALQPRDPELETVATNYSAALATVVPLINKAYNYYDRERYKDDKFVEGKAMHAALEAAFDAFDAADTALGDKVDVIQDEVDGHKLAKFEKNFGKTSYPYMVRNALVTAKVAIREADRPLKELKLGKLTKAINDHTTASEALDKQVTSKNDASWFALATYTRSQVEFNKACSERFRRVRDNKPWTASEQRLLNGPASWTVEGSSSKMVRAYNKMIDDFNRLNKDTRWQGLFTAAPQDDDDNNGAIDD